MPFTRACPGSHFMIWLTGQPILSPHYNHSSLYRHRLSWAKDKTMRKHDFRSQPCFTLTRNVGPLDIVIAVMTLTAIFFGLL